MEKILNIEIIDDYDLHELFPNLYFHYYYLRMQMRSQGKYTNYHGILKSCNWKRKSHFYKRDNDKLSRDIMKICNEFKGTCLSNGMIVKQLEQTKSNKLYKNQDSFLNHNENNLNIDPILRLHACADHSTDLVVKNCLGFKVGPNRRQKLSKFFTDKRINKNKVYRNINKIFKYQTSKETNEEWDNILRVECKYTRTDTVSMENTVEASLIEVVEQGETKSEEKKDSDLQTLLIMMAITSKSKVIESDFDENRSNVDDIINNKESIAPNETINRYLDNSTLNNVLYIKPIKNGNDSRHTYLSNKYIDKWRLFVNNRKEYKEQQKKLVLDRFIERLAKKKNDLSHLEHDDKTTQFVRDYSTYQHRYKVQKHIIALQKAKLEEQNRLIEELKYNKIIESSRQSVDAMREEVRKTYYEIDRHLKPKIKCLTNELKIPEIEEPSLVLHCLKVPQFLQRMEKRARKREEKHALIRERRRQMEEERQRLKQQAELAKVEMDKEEKMKRMKELKDKRKREKIENIRKKQYIERMRALIIMADMHYEKHLMIKYVIRPFKKLLDIKQDNMEKAKIHYRFQLRKNVFLNWMWYTEDMWFERNYKADDFYRKKMLKKVFNAFKIYYNGYVLKKQVADDYYDFYVTQLVFRKFRDILGLIKKENELKWKKVILYYNSNILFKTFTCWRTLPALNALKREQEVRKARWREKVLQVVPDYAPPED